MTSKKALDLINVQVMKELYSAYLYLDMSTFYAIKGLDGYSNWFNIQAQEEMAHAMLMREYLLNNDYDVKLLPIDAPDKEFKQLIDPLKASLEHEQLVTSLIDAIYEAAAADKDYRTTDFITWFIKEQGEEEKTAGSLIQKFELFGNDSRGLYLLDQEYAARTYSPPSLVLD